MKKVVSPLIPAVLFALILVIALPAASLAEWTVETIDAAGDVGWENSIAVDSNGNVHIAYYDVTYGNLKYAANVSGPWDITTIDSSGDVGRLPDITIDSNNKVHISYGSMTNYDLKYATNTSGSWVTTIINGSDIAGGYKAIAVDSNDKVHICYFNGAPYYDVKYTTNSSGSWVTTTIDNLNTYVSQISMALDANNNAHISYYDQTNNDLKYVTNTSGSWISTIIDSTGSVGDYSSIAVDYNNKVHISYLGTGLSGLKYATNMSGSWLTTTLDSTGWPGFFTSLAIDLNNKVHISYYDAVSCSLKYATNASGSWVLSTIDNSSDVGKGTSIAIGPDNNVHISYYDETYADLKYTVQPDNSPDPFTFTDQSGVPLDTVIVSNRVTVSGINGPTPVSIIGGEYSIGLCWGGWNWTDCPFTSEPGTVNDGDTVAVRLTSSSSYSATTSATLTIGDISDTFSVTTVALDAFPDEFIFTDQTDVPVDTVIVSDRITVSGINGPAPVSIVGGEYSIGLCWGGWNWTDCPFTSEPGTVNDGDTVAVRLTSSSSYSATTSATLTIGDISDTFSVTTVAGGTGQCIQPHSGLVSWWPGDDNVDDIIGPNNGVALNGTTFADGMVGQAFSLDGVDDEVLVPHHSNQNTGSQITIDAWVNPISYGHGRPIAQKRSSSNVGGFTFETTHSPWGSDNGLQFVIWIGGTPYTLQTLANVITVNTWQYVAATFDGVTMKIYVDGIEKADTLVSGVIDASTDPLVIGMNVVYPSFVWHGFIDEIKLFDRALSQTEIQAIYNAGSTGMCKPAVCTDLDDDGYGNPGSASCPNGAETDCDDNNGTINPGATEVCNGIDDNCNVQLDEGVLNTYCQDDDGDGFGNASINLQQCTPPQGYVSDNSDCDDTNSAINPNTLWYPDSDEDGYGNPSIAYQQCTPPAGPPDYVLNNSDYNDNDPHIYPGGPPIRIVGTPSSYYSSVQEAYNTSVNGDIIQAQAVTFIGNLSINLNKSITVSGGFDGAFVSQLGKTVIKSNMSITNGTINVENFEVQP